MGSSAAPPGSQVTNHIPYGCFQECRFGLLLWFVVWPERWNILTSMNQLIRLKIFFNNKKVLHNQKQSTDRNERNFRASSVSLLNRRMEFSVIQGCFIKWKFILTSCKEFFNRKWIGFKNQLRTTWLRSSGSHYNTKDVIIAMPYQDSRYYLLFSIIKLSY